MTEIKYEFNKESCFYLDVCPLKDTKDCNESCLRYLEMFYLMNKSRLPKSQHKIHRLKKIAEKLGQIVEVDKGVEGIRLMIKTAYGVTNPILYHVADSEKMSAQAVNSLLKVTEEPPRKAYFALTVTNPDNILPTIKSRAMEIKLAPYSDTEILEYAQSLEGAFNEEELVVIKAICENPGEVNSLLKIDILEFWDYLTLVFEKIGVSSGVNSFKIAGKMKFKEDGTGYDPLFFMKSMSAYILSKVKEGDYDEDYDRRCLKTLEVIAKYRKEMEIKSINKSATFDMFIMDLRDIWV